MRRSFTKCPLYQQHFFKKIPNCRLTFTYIKVDHRHRNHYDHKTVKVRTNLQSWEREHCEAARQWVMGIHSLGRIVEGGEDAGSKLCQECAISERAIPRVGKGMRAHDLQENIKKGCLFDDVATMEIITTNYRKFNLIRK